MGNDDSLKSVLCTIRAKANAITTMIERGEIPNDDPTLLAELGQMAQDLARHVTKNGYEIMPHHKRDLKTVCTAYS